MLGPSAHGALRRSGCKLPSDAPQNLIPPHSEPRNLDAPRPPPNPEPVWPRSDSQGNGNAEQSDNPKQKAQTVASPLRREICAYESSTYLPPRPGKIVYELRTRHLFGLGASDRCGTASVITLARTPSNLG